MADNETKNQDSNSAILGIANAKPTDGHYWYAKMTLISLPADFRLLSTI